MNKTQLVLIFVWIALAIVNIVSLFTVSTFLLCCNYAFGFMNGLMALALLPQVLRYTRKRIKGEE